MNSNKFRRGAFLVVALLIPILHIIFQGYWWSLLWWSLPVLLLGLIVDVLVKMSVDDKDMDEGL